MKMWLEVMTDSMFPNPPAISYYSSPLTSLRPGMCYHSHLDTPPPNSLDALAKALFFLPKEKFPRRSILSSFLIFNMITVLTLLSRLPDSIIYSIQMTQFQLHMLTFLWSTCNASSYLQGIFSSTTSLQLRLPRTELTAFLLKPTPPQTKWSTTFQAIVPTPPIILDSSVVFWTFNQWPNFGHVASPKSLPFVPFLYPHCLSLSSAAQTLSLTHENHHKFFKLVSLCLSLPISLSRLLPDLYS